jgi:hypothetical protein
VNFVPITLCVASQRVFVVLFRYPSYIVRHKNIDTNQLRIQNGSELKFFLHDHCCFHCYTERVSSFVLFYKHYKAVMPAIGWKCRLSGVRQKTFIGCQWGSFSVRCHAEYRDGNRGEYIGSARKPNFF